MSPLGLCAKGWEIRLRVAALALLAAGTLTAVGCAFGQPAATPIPTLDSETKVAPRAFGPPVRHKRR